MSDTTIAKMAKRTVDRASGINGGTIVFTAIILVSALLSAIFFWRHSAQVFAGLPVLLATAFGLIIGLLPSEGAFFGWKNIRKANEGRMTSQQMKASKVGLWSGVAFAVMNIVAVFVTSFPEVPAAIRDLAGWMVFIALLLPIPTQFIAYSVFVMGDPDVQDGYRRSVLYAAQQHAIHTAELAKLGAVIDAAEQELKARLPHYSAGAATEEVARLLEGRSTVYLTPTTQPVNTQPPDAATVAAILAAIQRGEIAVPVAMSNSTHAPQPTAHPAPGQGQGNGPAAKPLGRDAQNPTPRP